MNRIEKTFKALDRPALVTFITAGDPDYEASLEVLKALPEAGVDIIELGMPFSDPMADGPVIEAASNRALKAGANMTRTLEMVRDFRTENNSTPIVLMGYVNPIFIYGIEAFAKDAAAAGVDGLLLVDLPPEESAELESALQEHKVDLIRLITPTTDEVRLKTLLKGASGFLYYVSITGVTGAASADINALKPHIEQVKLQTDLPVCIGFGIKTPEDAATMGAIADGVVVGSAIVKNMEEISEPKALRDTIKAQVKALSDSLDA